ncbi:MAG: hypothetical protein ACFB5Z_20530 [Elainellaceae cyanobacterium]
MITSATTASATPESLAVPQTVAPQPPIEPINEISLEAVELLMLGLLRDAGVVHSVVVTLIALSATPIQLETAGELADADALSILAALDEPELPIDEAAVAVLPDFLTDLPLESAPMSDGAVAVGIAPKEPAAVITVGEAVGPAVPSEATPVGNGAALVEPAEAITAEAAVMSVENAVVTSGQLASIIPGEATVAAADLVSAEPLGVIAVGLEDPTGEVIAMAIVDELTGEIAAVGVDYALVDGSLATAAAQASAQNPDVLVYPVPAELLPTGESTDGAIDSAIPIFITDLPEAEVPMGVDVPLNAMPEMYIGDLVFGAVAPV